jgi:hypothetical protein
MAGNDPNGRLATSDAARMQRSQIKAPPAQLQLRMNLSSAKFNLQE